MQYSEKLGLKLPEGSDNYNIDDMNYNSSIIDKNVLSSKYTSVTASISGTNRSFELPAGISLDNIENNEIINIKTPKWFQKESFNVSRRIIKYNPNDGNYLITYFDSTSASNWKFGVIDEDGNYIKQPEDIDMVPSGSAKILQLKQK